MAYHRIDPDDPGLPDIEVWSDYETTAHCKHCGIVKGPEAVINEEPPVCPDCGRKTKIKHINYQHRWYAWICVPGCNPDSDYMGPFDSENQAVEAIRALANSMD